MFRSSWMETRRSGLRYGREGLFVGLFHRNLFREFLGGRGFRGQEPDIRPDPSRGCVEWSLSRPMMQKWENACPPPS